MKALASWQLPPASLHSAHCLTAPLCSRNLHSSTAKCGDLRCSAQHEARPSHAARNIAASRGRPAPLQHSSLHFDHIDIGSKLTQSRSPAFARRRSGTAVAAAAIAEPPVTSSTNFGAASENPVIRIESPGELNEQLAAHGPHLVILMCKAHSCRPCKMFGRKYSRLADAYPDVTFLEIFGDDTVETRRLMISMGIKVTPTFRLYRSGKCVHQLSGVSETNLRNAIEEH